MDGIPCFVVEMAINKVDGSLRLAKISGCKTLNRGWYSSIKATRGPLSEVIRNIIIGINMRVLGCGIIVTEADKGIL